MVTSADPFEKLREGFKDLPEILRSFNESLSNFIDKLIFICVVISIALLVSGIREVVIIYLEYSNRGNNSGQENVQENFPMVINDDHNQNNGQQNSSRLNARSG